jgi:lipoprotein-anchoring transpeptidase ErfK/SrfK
MTRTTPDYRATSQHRAYRAAVVGVLVVAIAAAPADAGGRRATRPVRAFAAADASDDGETDARSIYIVLRLGERRLHVMQTDDDGATDRRLASFPVAIGRAEYATPTGRFRVREKLVEPDFVQFDWNDPSRVIGRVSPGPDNPLGVRWIGFTTAYGWTIGFHGTPQPELLGQAVSHGCVRMRNRDVVELYRRVDIGTPVIVEP